MRSTILSENQYETKFITTANTKATIRPPAPPKNSPMASRTALRRPRSRAVLMPLFMVQMLALGQAAEQPGQQCGTRCQGGQFHVLVQRMGSPTDSAEAV